MFARAIEDLFRDHASPAAVRRIEAGGDPLPLWNIVADAGFLALLVPESADGAGLPLHEFHQVVVLCGRFASPLPLAQAMAARALVAAPAALPAGILTLAPALVRTPQGGLRAPRVPYGLLARWVLGVDGDGLVLLPCGAATRRAVIGGASALADLDWAPADQAQALPGDARRFAPMAAAVYAALIAGAASQAFEMTLRYCNERIQFGRSLGKFQAVQHQLAVMAQLVAACAVAAEAAFHSDDGSPPWQAAAVAKARTSEAAAQIAGIAHALHGAIGITEAYDLQLLTRRLREWSGAHGGAGYWERLLGERLLASGLSAAAFVRQQR